MARLSYLLADRQGSPSDNTMRGARIERTIREHLRAHPDEAFTTDDLCVVCYPDVLPIERKHRVAVVRASGKVRAIEPDWHCICASYRGNTLVFFNAASVSSTAKAVVKVTDPKRRLRARREEEAGSEPSAIVTIRKRGSDRVPDMTPEEHQRHGDAAEAMFREMKRAIAATR